MIASYAYDKSIKTTNLKELRDGSPYTWGKVLEIIDIGEYTLVRYCCDFGRNQDKELFASYLAGKDTCRSSATVEGALVQAIAQNYDGLNSQAAHYFLKMIGAPIDE